MLNFFLEATAITGIPCFSISHEHQNLHLEYLEFQFVLTVGTLDKQLWPWILDFNLCTNAP